MNSVSQYWRCKPFDLRQLLLLSFVIAGLLCNSGAFADDDEIITGNFVVSLTGEDGQRPWIVKALEQNIYNDLSGYARVVAVQKALDETEICPRQKLRCILDLYESRNVDALMLGSVDKSRIEFEVYDVENKYLVNSGSIKFGNSASLLKLRLGAFKAFKIFIEKGGILDDQVDTNDTAESQVATDALVDVDEPIATTDSEDVAPGKYTPFPATADFRLKLLIALAGIACLPLFLATFGRPLTHPDRSRVLLRWCYPFMIVSLSLIGLQVLMELNDGGNIVSEFLELFEGSFWILAGIGGAVWGSFLIVNFKIVVPHLTGIERIEKENLFRLLRSCLVTMLIKSMLVASFYAAIFYVVIQLGDVFSYSRDAAVLLVFPIAGLFVFYWIALMLDVFAMSNDVKLSGKRFEFNSEWNLKIRKYFTSYLKRNGLTLERRLVDEIAFIPGQHKGVVSYRGGFGRPRIAIEKDLLIFALGDIDESDPGDEIEEFYEKREDPELRQNGIFRIQAGSIQRGKMSGLFRGRTDRRRADRMEKFQKRLQRHLDSNRMNRGAVSGNALSSGVVMPLMDTTKASPALLSNGPNDIRVLEDLFREYAMRHQQHEDEADVDDSSEFDRDFLFGALLHQFGSILRYDTIWSTTRLYFARKKKIRENRYNYVFSKHFALIADTFVVLNFGLNHLIQYLFYKATKDQTFLTTKGVPGRMLENQAQILANSKEMIGQRKSPPIRTDELDRISWLSRFSQEAIHRNPAAVLRRRRIFRVSISLIFASLASLLIMQAYDYHPRYLEIIEMEKQDIEEAIEAQREKERKKANE